ncbi:MAG: YHS domain-containing protein [DPANN group archaeon]|nr:YHS domain-containing protein [DPANN group archaeon]
MVRDFVCGMEIREGTLKSTLNAKTYYFCSQNCKQAFDRAPKKFAV